MSVINKMLRDLDRRNAAPPELRRSSTPAPSFGATAGGAPRSTWAQPARLGLAGSLLALAVAGGWWWLQRGTGPATPPAPNAAPPAAPIPAPAAATGAPAAYPWLQDSATEVHAQKLMSGDGSAGAAPQEGAKAPAPEAAASAVSAASKPAKAPAVAAAAPQAVPAKAAPAAPSPAASPSPSTAAGKGLVIAPPAPVIPPPVSTPSAPVAPKIAAAPPAAASVNTATTPTSAAAATGTVVNAANAPQASTVGATAGALDATQRQQQAGRDALAQAQGLWNNGNKDAAIELLRQATSAQERNQSGNPSPAGRALLLSLVRELTRMELADGRPAAALDVLARQDGLTASEPELLAVRANAAQRMGRHQESINAYRAALQLRPTEQRWLLGAAVSMAALGQTAAATDMAERARQVGPISREVLAYLRQAGVTVRD